MLKVRKIFDRNRSKFEIIAEILRKSRKPTCRTNIMSRCNMNTKESGRYLNLLRLNDLIRRNESAGKITYQRTEAGREFLKLFDKMILLLDSGISATILH